MLENLSWDEKLESEREGRIESEPLNFKNLSGKLSLLELQQR